MKALITMSMVVDMPTEDDILDIARSIDHTVAAGGMSGLFKAADEAGLDHTAAVEMLESQIEWFGATVSFQRSMATQ